MLSPAGPGPPLLKQLLSLAICLCKYTRGPPLGASSVLLESLLDLLHGCLLLLHLTLWNPVRYTTAQLFLMGAEHEPRWSPSHFFLLPPLPGRPAQVPAHKDEGCNGFLYTYLATLLYCFIVSNSFLTGSLQFLHEESYHLQKVTSILLLYRFGCFLFLSLA